jgi:hypothetical protein
MDGFDQSVCGIVNKFCAVAPFIDLGFSLTILIVFRLVSGVAGKVSRG